MASTISIDSSDAILSLPNGVSIEFSSMKVETLNMPLSSVIFMILFENESGILGHHTSLHHFKRYAMKEHSEENLLFYRDVEEFANCNENEQRKRLLSGILKEYLLDGAVMQINVSKQTVEQFKKAMEEEEVSQVLFFEFNQNAITSVMDTYGRFQRSDKFPVFILSLFGFYKGNACCVGKGLVASRWSGRSSKIFGKSAVLCAA